MHMPNRILAKKNSMSPIETEHLMRASLYLQPYYKLYSLSQICVSDIKSRKQNVLRQLKYLRNKKMSFASDHLAWQQRIQKEQIEARRFHVVNQTFLSPSNKDSTYFSSSRLMSPGFRSSALSPRGDDQGYLHTNNEQATPRHLGALGKNAYALAFGGSDFSRILLNNKGQKHPPLSPNVMDNLMRKSMNPEETASIFQKPKNLLSGGEILVPRDFMIKTAYVKKRRNNASQRGETDAMSIRSRQSSAITVFTKQSAQIAQQATVQPSHPTNMGASNVQSHMHNPAQQVNNSQALSSRLKQKVHQAQQLNSTLPFPKIQRLNEDVESNAQVALQMASKGPGKASQPFAVQYHLPTSGNVPNDTKSVISTASHRQAASAVGSQRAKPVDMGDSVSGTKEQVTAVDENGTPIQEAEQSEDEREELFDEINSLYNMENPRGADEDDDRRSQYTSLSKRSNRSSTTTTLIISQLAKQLEEERDARKKLEEELESIKQLSYQLISTKNSQNSSKLASQITTNAPKQ